MTAQIADTITIQGEQHLLFTEPLETYYSDRPRPAFVSPHTGNWRGYEGAWEIRDGKLFLTAVTANVCTGVRLPQTYGLVACEDYGGKLKAAGIGDIFPGAAGPVFADWYTGVLRVPLGRMIGYVHMGYESQYEMYLHFNVVKGVITRTW